MVKGTLQSKAVFTEAAGAGVEYGSFIKTRHPVNKTGIKGKGEISCPSATENP